MKSLLKTILFAVLPLAAAGTEARFTVPFDGTPEIVGKPGEKLPEARIFGRTGYVDGVSGKALSVRRHAYDQVTAVNISAVFRFFRARREASLSGSVRIRMTRAMGTTGSILPGAAAKSRVI